MGWFSLRKCAFFPQKPCLPRVSLLFPQKPPCFPPENRVFCFSLRKDKDDKDRQGRQGHDQKDKEDKEDKDMTKRTRKTRT